MAMSERELQRNIGRIPRLLFHIKRCKANGQDERVAGFQEELERRKLEMKLAGMEQHDGSVTRKILGEAGLNHAELLKTLLAVKLTPARDAEYVALDDLYMRIFPDVEEDEILKPATLPGT